LQVLLRDGRDGPTACRLFAGIDQLGLAEKTLILLTGNNGPTAWAHYYEAGIEPPGSTAGDRGRKWSLYEGGIREPLIVRCKGTVPAGRLDESSVIAAVDFFPTLTRLAGVPLPEAVCDGEDASAALRGQSYQRMKPLIWDYRQDIKPGRASDVSPLLAVRRGNWKLLMNPDGSAAELYNLATDPAESNNLIADSRHTAIRLRLRQDLDQWLAQRTGMDVVRQVTPKVPGGKTSTKKKIIK
jgi:arylsulfatase A-like enzyme